MALPELSGTARGRRVLVLESTPMLPLVLTVHSRSSGVVSSGTYRWQKRVRMVAASARVAVPAGTRVLLVRPLISPSALAHRRASTAQEPMEAASV